MFRLKSICSIELMSHSVEGTEKKISKRNLVEPTLKLTYFIYEHEGRKFKLHLKLHIYCDTYLIYLTQKVDLVLILDRINTRDKLTLL